MVAQRVAMNSCYLPWFEVRTFKGRPLKASIDQRLASKPSNQQTMKANAYKAMRTILRIASRHGLPCILRRNLRHSWTTTSLGSRRQRGRLQPRPGPLQHRNHCTLLSQTRPQCPQRGTETMGQHHHEQVVKGFFLPDITALIDLPIQFPKTRSTKRQTFSLWNLPKCT